jgi:AAT family amino acid transporter
MLVMFLGWKIIKRTKWVGLYEMDLETDVYKPEEVEEEPGTKSRLRKIRDWIF